METTRSRAALTGSALAVVAAVTVPVALADPDQTTSGSPTTPATAASSPSGAFALDARGYVGSAAHCDDTQVAVALGRTSRAVVAICVNPDGQLEYRGVRLSDQASVRVPAGRTADGTIVATNDGVTYAVSPAVLLVSDGDTVLYRDAWVEFRQPRFSDDAPETGSTSSAPTTTVSTTTVTPAPASKATDS